eukprot:scaffold1077_cov344-Pavlova_lutheri.AAC.1
MVYHSSGVGRRSITSWEFVNKWLPLSTVNRAGMMSSTTRDKSPHFYYTYVVWDFVHSGLPEERLKACRKMLEEMASCTTWYRVGNVGATIRRPSGILVPNGPNQSRPNRTIKHWLEVVGRHDDPFVQPTPRGPRKVRRVEVTRTILTKEYEFFQQSCTR